MSMRTYTMGVEDGKAHAGVTLRDVVERCDVSDLPMLAEIKRLYAENDRLRALLQDVAICASGRYCYGCPHQYDGCDRDERLRAEGIEVR